MGGVFINYRVKDNPLGAAGIHDMLARRFGYDNVFRDCVSMQAGDHYPTALREGLNRADVLVVVIGPRWNTLGSEDGGTPHIQRERDWVRWEIAAAIKRRIPVVPVLLTDLPERTERPDPNVLPENIRELAHYQVFELSQRRFGADLDRLTARLLELVRDLPAPQVFDGPPPTRTADHVPSTLLRPEYAIVPFDGRTGLLEDLRAWAMRSPASVLRLVTGPAGSGKTRLAHELCRQLAAKGWRAGIVSGDALAAQITEIGASADRPLLIVVDQAEATTAHLPALATAIGDRPGAHGPMRLLLLARTAGTWLGGLGKHSDSRVAALFGAMTAADTVALDAGTDDRYGRFATAYSAFATELGQTEIGTGQPIGIESCGSLLEIHAAALDSALCNAGVGAETVHQNGNPLARILRHDRRHWRRLARREGMADLDMIGLNTLTTVATLCQPASETQVASLRSRLGNFIGDDRYHVDQYVEFLGRLYPGAHLLSAVGPAALGEELVAATLVDQPSIGITLAANSTDEQITNALTMLGQMYVQRPEIATVIVDLLRVDPDRLIPIAVGIMSRLEQPEKFSRLVSTALSDTTIRPDSLLGLMDQLGRSTDDPATKPIAVGAMDALTDWAYQFTDRLREDHGIQDTPLSTPIRKIADGLTNLLRDGFAAYMDPASGRSPKDANGKDILSADLLGTMRMLMDLRNKLNENYRDQETR